MPKIATDMRCIGSLLTLLICMLVSVNLMADNWNPVDTLRYPYDSRMVFIEIHSIGSESLLITSLDGTIVRSDLEGLNLHTLVSQDSVHFAHLLPITAVEWIRSYRSLSTKVWYVERTRDAGVTWQKMYSDSSATNVNLVSALNSNIVGSCTYIFGSGSIRLSYDGGQSFTTTNLDSAYFSAICAIDAARWIVGNRFGKLFITSDSGRTWTTSYLSSSRLGNEIQKIVAFGDTVYALNQFLNISHDGGRSWSVDTDRVVTAIAFNDALQGYQINKECNMLHPEIRFTHDGGNTWDYDETWGRCLRMTNIVCVSRPLKSYPQLLAYGFTRQCPDINCQLILYKRSGQLSGVDEIDEQDSSSLYLSADNRLLHLRLDPQSSVELFDLRGATLLRTNCEAESPSLLLPTLSPGMYILRAQSAQRIKVMTLQILP